MTNQTNTSGGASIDGNVETNEFVGRDKTTIQYIVNVGMVFELARIGELFPQLHHSVDFSSIAQAIESNLDNRLNKELADAVVWVGELLNGFVNKWIVEDSDKPVVLSDIVNELISHVGTTLKINRYWDASSMSYTDGLEISRNTTDYDFDSVLPLEVTTTLFQKNVSNTLEFYIISGKKSINLAVKECDIFDAFLASSNKPNRLILYSTKRFTPKQLRIILAGIIFDLIRIKSDNAVSAQFLQGLADTFRTKTDNG